MAAQQQSDALVHAVERVGDRWTLLVIDALLAGPRRFGEIASDVVGIAPNILTSRLRHLEREGLAISRPYSRRPVRMAYELTAAGRALAGSLRLLAQWAVGHATGVTGPAHSECGTPMEARWYCPTCARVVDDREASEDLRYV